VRDVAVLCGDAPFMDAATLKSALSFTRRSETPSRCCRPEFGNPAATGASCARPRALRPHCRSVRRDERRASIREINAGTYWFSIDCLRSLLPLLDDRNAQGELYLTDMVELSVAAGRSVGAFVCPDARVALGANDAPPWRRSTPSRAKRCSSGL
jgi:bifunctional UDP-N-acetylglucosamine pyrophosphorylase/glucosamine-1-phosphate N-acetyltransferase